MKYYLIPIIILTLYLSSCNTKTKNIEFDSDKEKINELLTRYFELKRYSGTVLVIQQDTLFYDSSFGFADYESTKPFTQKTVFKIGEISELITKDILETFVVKRQIQLTDSIAEHIPEIQSKYTINDLLNHNTDFPSIEAIAKKNPELNYDTITFANLVNDSIPSEKKSNLNYNIMGILIEKISEKSFQENITEYSKTLGLENTYYDNQNSKIAIGYQYHNYRNKGLELQKTSDYNLDMAFSSRGLKSTAKDLVKIIDQNSNQNISISGYTRNDGFSYSLQNDPENKTKIIVLSNFKQPITDEILSSINSILDSKTYHLPLERKPFDINKDVLVDYTGNYALNEFVKFEVIARNDSLFAILGPNEAHLVPQSNNQFYMQDRDAAMRFLRDSSNKVNRVELLDGFIDGQIAQRTNN